MLERKPKSRSCTQRLGAIAAALIANGVVVGDGPVVPGREVPNLAGVSWLRGDPVTGFQPGRVYVLEFWSTWCAACVESIDGLNELARRHREDATFIAIHIRHQEPAPTPAQFLQRRLSAGKPVMEFAVAEDIDGGTAKAWMDATESSGFPTAMIVDRESRLVWFGHPRDLERPLREVIDGTFDVPQSLAKMHLRIRVSRLADQSTKAIGKGEYEEGIRLILEAFDADPDTAADWIPSTYGHLLAASGSPAVAAAFAQAVLGREAANRPELLAAMAAAILYFKPKELRDLDLALRLAKRADAMDHGRDPQIRALVAALRAELGDLPGAIRDLEAAMETAPTQQARDVLARQLSDLRNAPRD